MPEGDTVHKIARALHSGLTGLKLRRLWLRLGKEFLQPQISQVSALGKHCLIDLSDGHCIRIHLGMYGRWSRYPLPHRSTPDEQLVLESNQEVFACIHPREVEWFHQCDKIRHPTLRTLGPDLLAAEPRWEQILERAYQWSPMDRPLGEVLLDQRIASGLGNVYKNELCFLGPLESGPAWKPSAGTSPYTRLGKLSETDFVGLYRRGRQLLLGNLGGWPRTTTADGARLPLTGKVIRTWVYARSGQACLLCRGRILSRHQGPQARATVWCPHCQPLDSWRNLIK